MQRLFSSLKQAFGQSIFMVAMLSLIAFSGLFIFVQPTSYSAPISAEGKKLIQQEKMDKASLGVDDREQAYEEQVKASADPDKVYEDNLKSYKETHPDENIVEKTVEGAEKLVDKATGKE